MALDIRLSGGKGVGAITFDPLDMTKQILPTPYMNTLIPNRSLAHGTCMNCQMLWAPTYFVTYFKTKAVSHLLLIPAIFVFLTKQVWKEKMEDKCPIQIPRVKLGSQGLEVSRLGFGCGGLSGAYNAPLSHEAGCAVIRDAFNKGITLFDTADVYGSNYDNEIMVGKALKHLPRDKIQLATKFGIGMLEGGGYGVIGTPEYMEELKRLVEEGKVRQLGIGIVAYSPLGRGFFGGKAVVERLPEKSKLVSHPRYKGANLDKNKLLYTRVANLAAKHGCTPPQLALAWILNQNVVPIPATTKIKNLDNNLGSLKVKLTPEDLKELSDAVPMDEVGGQRDYGLYTEYNWEFANTPPKKLVTSFSVLE
ncbi:hypothetical protein IFM89_034034 [Coptis chinensis]|uniref:NADP-dependent oxidoreductase domain-containing protein n=1 Tax=Coptis chinensis TaxID=261450 RepID=A0A835ISY1_9MAGN|nr:hypothetical protein IFM89_034034 [Coptis chinensis]